MLDQITRSNKPHAPTLVRCLWGPPLVPGQMPKPHAIGSLRALAPLPRAAALNESRPVRLLQHPWAGALKLTQPPSIVCEPQGGKARNAPNTLSENNQRRPPVCNFAGSGRHTEQSPRGFLLFDVFWSSPHSPGGWCAPPLGVLGNLRAEFVGHHSENSGAGRDGPGPRRFGIVACEFLRAGWDSWDRPKKTDREGERHTQCRSRSAKENPPHTTWARVVPADVQCPWALGRAPLLVAPLQS